MNKITVIGRLTVDPQIRNAGNSTVTTFGLAANSMHKNAEGAYIPMFYRVSVWGKHGEQCARYLHKGDRCAAIGDFFMKEYKRNSGETAFAHEIENASIEFLNNPATKESSKPIETAYDDDLPF